MEGETKVSGSGSRFTRGMNSHSIGNVDTCLMQELVGFHSIKGQTGNNVPLLNQVSYAHIIPISGGHKAKLNRITSTGNLYSYHHTTGKSI